ncbi:RING finger and WD repeat domain-containing protein 3, partial [Linderina macrospora]
MSTDSGAATPKLDEADDIEAEESNTCLICYERWTHRGNHQLASLKCGHLFGHSCIKRWILRGPSGRGWQGGHSKDKAACPVCKQRAAVKDIRKLVATAITAVDGEKLENALADNRQLQDKCLQLKSDVSHFQLEYHRMSNEVQKLRNELDVAEKQKQWILLKNENLEKRLAETLASKSAGEPKLSLLQTVSMEESPSAKVEKPA